MVMNERATQDTVGIRVRRVADAVGAEVINIDLSRPLDGGVVEFLKDAFRQHHLLVFPDQQLTPEQQTAFSKYFGPLEAFPQQDKTKDAAQIYHVANVSAAGEKLTTEDADVIYQMVNQRWHTDSSYRFIPSLASIMYAIEVLPDEAEGGETEFSNMLLAYEALPEGMKRRLEPLHMVHYYEFGRRLYPQLPPISAAEREGVPPVCHPVIRVHADRGYRRSLFFTTNAGNEIGGMTRDEGDRLHKELADFVSEPRFRHGHRWRVGDLVMWDNRVLLHRAARYDMNKYRRVLRRTTVAGNGPIMGPFSAEARPHATE